MFLLSVPKVVGIENDVFASDDAGDGGQDEDRLPWRAADHDTDDGSR